jgi:hypothetical protein
MLESASRRLSSTPAPTPHHWNPSRLDLARLGILNPDHSVSGVHGPSSTGNAGGLYTLCRDNGLASGLIIFRAVPPRSIGDRPSIVLYAYHLEAVFLVPWFACLQSARRE